MTRAVEMPGVDAAVVTVPGAGNASPVDPGAFDPRLRDAIALERSLDDDAGSTRWMGWRLRMLVGAALIGSMALFLLARWLGDAWHIEATWRIGHQGQVELASTADPALRPFIGQALDAVVGADGIRHPLDALALVRSSRWIVDDADRERHRALHEALASAVAQGRVSLVFADGRSGEPRAVKRSTAGLGSIFWLLGAFALVLYLVSMVVVLSRPKWPNVLYALMALCQTGNLLFIATESTLSLGLRDLIPQLDMPLRMAFDLITAAAVLAAIGVHPRRLPGARTIAFGAFATVTLLLALHHRHALPQPWWWTQGTVLGFGAAAIGLLTWSHRLAPHPLSLVLRRFGIVTVATLALLVVALSMARQAPRIEQEIASIGSMVWYVFFAALLLLVPFLSKSQQIMREFSLLAAISTVATSLDLLFVAVFSFGQFASLTLSLFLSLGVYAGVRQWLLNQLLGSSMLTTERMFEQLYRIAREVEAHPERTPALLSHLVRDLFEPMEVVVLRRATSATRVAHAGSALVIPVPQLDGDVDARPASSIVLRFAHRGRRLFTSEDARLADRITEQLRRAVAFDKAVEQGRSEERARLAQDLHDDIGARLLTLMYKAASPEIEEYVRHTLKDLKTLTRGLAASNHRLSHAAAEWKADLTQRLTVAQIEVRWHCRFDEDIQLNVVQWSGLTRVLRELVSNVIAHSGAGQVDIRISLRSGRLDLSVTDDGRGCDPRTWSHGLGLGGVRKRVKQLGGEVEWRQAEPRGGRVQRDVTGLLDAALTTTVRRLARTASDPARLLPA